MIFLFAAATGRGQYNKSQIVLLCRSTYFFHDKDTGKTIHILADQCNLCEFISDHHEEDIGCA